MTIVELVDHLEIEPETVAEEVRPGYSTSPYNPENRAMSSKPPGTLCYLAQRRFQAALEVFVRFCDRGRDEDGDPASGLHLGHPKANLQRRTRSAGT